VKKVTQQTIEEIRARCDIADVIGGYIELRRAGSSFKALCPFHQEKTPSFHVNPQRQIFHCFGCGAGGDVFRFVMEREGCDFTTALRMLARRAGVEIQLDDDDGTARGEKDLLLQLHEDAATFYHRVLQEHPSAAEARDYLKARDLAGEALERFRLGYAPDVPGALLKWAAQKKYAPAQLVRAGLLAGGDEAGGGGGGSYYDRFRQRLMIPIGDELGRVIGFSGRILRAELSPAKYVNSPETPLFRKSRILFAFDKARKAIVDSRRAIVCEGQIDTIRCHLAGVQNVVAAQGTAITDEHARQLRRYADEVVLVLDADAAGQKAAVRSSQVLLASGLAVRAASLPEGEDPDTLIRARGPKALLDAIEQAVPAVTFQIRWLASTGAMAGEAGLSRGARAVLETVACVPDAVQRERMIRQASDGLGVSEEALRQDLRAMMRRASNAAARTARDDAAAAAPPALPAAPEHPAEEVGLLEMAAAHPGHAEMLRRYLPPRAVSDPLCRRLYERLLARRTPDEPILGPLEAADADASRLVARIEMSPRTKFPSEVPVEDALRSLVRAVWRRRLERRREEVRSQAATAAGDGRTALQLESQDLTLRIKALQESWAAAQHLIETEVDRLSGETDGR
jgi:DNA primase